MSAFVKSKIRVLALAACLTLGAAACADSSDGPEAAPTGAPVSTEASATLAPAPEMATETAAPAPASDLPSVELVDVATGATVNLASFAPADQPFVLWFWAPH
ncbi:hypothetical protein [Candidatus Poriferisocius sp.]|uniref:hypothetical protein n=1 Tax=Candidatus Poriferisocius sp. TaxID=3101276 RepID=UPI003B5C2BC6